MSLQYDSTVRNSENTVVQFTYGDDGLHPDKMENNDRPVDFDRLRLHISQIAPCPDEPALEGDALIELVNKKLAEDRFKEMVSTGGVFVQEIRDYFSSLVSQQKNAVSDADKDDPIGYRTWYSSRVTETQLKLLLQSAFEKFLLAFVEPGEAVGAIGAQSISEPGTQMTLKVRTISQKRLL